MTALARKKAGPSQRRGKSRVNRRSKASLPPRDSSDTKLLPPEGLEASVLRVEGRELALLRLPMRARDILLAALTPAERLVLKRLLNGDKPSEIAASTGRAKRTVSNQLNSAYEKLGVHSLTELVALLSRLNRPK